MPVLDLIAQQATELTRIRRDIHAHPEIGFEEHRTSSLVAEKLAEWGIEVHRGIGGTGVVGLVHGKGEGPSIGLRADMDALPMEELTNASHRSTKSGVFHGCGHDGHTTMLLGAAHYLAATRNFPGKIVLIFQPAEEGLGGAVAMIRDGLFERFPCDEIYALHNWPGAEVGKTTTRCGVAMAASDNFDIVISGRGAHGAQPHNSIDPIMVAASLAQALQTIVSRNVDPLSSATLSITQIHGGSAYNVIPDNVTLSGTIRTFDEATRALIAERMRAISMGVAQGFGAEVEVSIRKGFRVLENSAPHAEAAIDIARTIVGDERVGFDADPMSGSEDFADMLALVPGAYLWLGQGKTAALHNPHYDFNDEILPIGASLLAKIGETRTQALRA